MEYTYHIGPRFSPGGYASLQIAVYFEVNEKARKTRVNQQRDAS